MDIETRLQKLESDLQRTKAHVWTLLAIVLVLLVLILLRVPDSSEWIISIMVVLALAALAHLLVQLASGLRLFWTRRAVDAQLQEKIMRDFIADRAKTQGQDHP